MNKFNTQLSEIEVEIAEAKEAIATAEALSRLAKNDDFKSLILEGYFKEYASDLVMYKALPDNMKEDSQSMISRSIDGVGFFRTYLDRITDTGKQAVIGLAEYESTQEEILAEDI